jgi:hypothetical protein
LTGGDHAGDEVFGEGAGLGGAAGDEVGFHEMWW